MAVVVAALFPVIVIGVGADVGNLMGEQITPWEWVWITALPDPAVRRYGDDLEWPLG
jgi:hypothetical protein